MISLLLLTSLAQAGTRTWVPYEQASGGQGRLALVIGNGDYAHTTDLPLARPDAERMVDGLRKSGFTVIQHWDLDQAGLKRAVADFKLKVQSEKPAATLTYYAGHAAEVRGQNYLLPVDANPPSAAHMDSDTTSLSWVLARIEEAGAPLNLLIVDACRNNPFLRNWFGPDRAASGPGLAGVSAPTGFFIAYPTGPGKVSIDGVYAEPLVQAMTQDCARLEDVFKQVHKSVLVRTQDDPEPQVPWTQAALGPGDFYFNERSCTAPVPPRRERVAGERMVSPSGIALRWVPATGSGGFEMGGATRVVLTEGRWVMESEVTRAMSVIGEPPPEVIEGRTLPWAEVSWCDAVAYANRLSLAEGLTVAYALPSGFESAGCTAALADTVQPVPRADGYRLLTEAEWEWAARAGQATTYAGGDEAGAVAWYAENSGGHAHPVCTKVSNAWGLCDMSGNLWEWVQDGYASTLPGGTDPLVRTGSSRVIRGGSWSYSESSLRVAYRSWNSPGNRWNYVGFRLSRSE